MKLCKLRIGLEAQIHAVPAHNGIRLSRGDLWGPGGSAQLDPCELPDDSCEHIAVLRDLVEHRERDF